MGIDPVSLAITVALNAAMMAVTASRTIEGPRLTDLEATVADYGTPLNYFYGRRRLGSACFFAEPIKEKVKKRKTKGGKYKDYTYYGTWAVAVADHEIATIERIWFDRHLIYDATSGRDLTVELADDYEIEMHMRFYYGTETQEPDERMLATIEASEGEGTCPAYRGVAYILFEDIPLEKIGNRFPQVSVDATTSTKNELILSLDFQNGVYELDGVERSVSEVIYEDASYAPFNYSDIIPGFGITVSVSTPTTFIASSGPVLTALAKASLLDGFVVVIDAIINDFSPTLSYSSASVTIDIAPSDFSTGWGVFSRIELDPTGTHRKCLVHDFASVEEAENTFTGNSFRHAARLVSTALSTAVNCGNVLTTGVPHSSVNDFIGIIVGCQINTSGSASITLRSVKFYSKDTPIGNLTPLSCGNDNSNAAPTLADIVNDISERVGLDLSDVETSAIDTTTASNDYTINGYSWTQGSAKQILEPLMSIYDVDPRPHGFGIEYLPRGGAVGATINTEDFVRQSEGDLRYKISLSNDTDLPRRLFLTFSDVDAEQQQNTAVAQRPLDAIDGARELNIDMSPLALESNEARQLTERYFRRIWFARETGELGLTAMELALEPGDVRTIEFDGDEIDMRLTKMIVGADGVLQTTWQRDNIDLALLSGSTGAIAAGIPPASVPAAGDTQGFVLDVPLFADVHDQTVPFLYVGAAPVNETDFWPGADILHSDDGAEDTYLSGWDGIGSTDAATWGTAMGTLSDALSSVIDRQTYLTIELAYGELESITEVEMLADGSRNLAMIGDEMIQFMTATLESSNTYTISGLIRGCRGTEQHIADHLANEQFLLIESVIKVHSIGASEIGDTDYYRAISQGLSGTSPATTAIAFTAAAHKPYSPAHLEAVRDTGSGDWTISWIRRTRIGGATLNGQDVPLGETSESYKVEILAGSDEAIRTITSTTNSVTYTSAQQSADFGSPQLTISYRVAQVSPALSLDGFWSSAAA